NRCKWHLKIQGGWLSRTKLLQINHQCLSFSWKMSQLPGPEGNVYIAKLTNHQTHQKSLLQGNNAKCPGRVTYIFWSKEE
ncbi:mCG1028300, isoform CRA_a, partial [Mus musculus]